MPPIRHAPTYFDLALERRQLLEDQPPSFQHPDKRMLCELSDIRDFAGAIVAEP
jgi:hypothetical protein